MKYAVPVRGTFKCRIAKLERSPACKEHSVPRADPGGTTVTPRDYQTQHLICITALSLPVYVGQTIKNDNPGFRNERYEETDCRARCHWPETSLPHREVPLA